jgi:hypothetical protein
MDIPFNRRDIGYTIISRFEETLRSFIANKITTFFNNFYDGLPQGVVSKAKERSCKDNWENIDDFLAEVSEHLLLRLYNLLIIRV